MSESEEPSAGAVIGLCFGNSYSSIASTQGGDDATVIANEEGDRQIPTILSYVEGEEYHGTQAKAQLVRNPQNTIAGFRDFVGKPFEAIDPSPSHTSAHPQPQGSTIAFSIRDTDSGDPHLVTISDITTRHLRRLRSSAADYLGKPVTAAVIAIPSSFSSQQRSVLTEAAKAAELEILQFISEPAATLLASDRRIASSNKPADKIAVVADLGGTRSDVSIVAVRGGMYTVLATVHDHSLGGSTLDTVLIDHFAKEFLIKHSSFTPEDPLQNPRSAARLKLESEAAKKSLSLGASASINIESLVSGLDFSATINRSRYELLAFKIFARFTRMIVDAVAKADLDVLEVDEVILAGGTAHTPRIAANVVSAFPDSTSVIAPSTVPNAVNPSELIVRGAALQAYMIEGFEAEDVEQSTHPAVTVTPHLAQTVGIAILNGDGEVGTEESFLPIVAAETPLPVRRTFTFLNKGRKGQDDSGVLIRICEGSCTVRVTKQEPKPKTSGAPKTDDNSGADSDDDSYEEEEEEEEVRSKEWKAGRVLGELVLKEATRGKKVTCQISISVDLSVHVSASETGTGKTGVGGTIPGGTNMNGSAH